MIDQPLNLNMALKSQFREYQNQLAKCASQTRLRNKQFTIISNNCWGGEVYKGLGLPYQSPFVGLFLFAPCYIKLLKNLRPHLECKLTFTRHSRYPFANDARNKGSWKLYPIGLLQDEVEIHFMHYESATEAEEKWLRRTSRIDWENPEQLFVKFCDHDPYSKLSLKDFDELKYLKKVCFTSQHHPDLSSSVWVKECQSEDAVVDGGSLYKVCKRYFDIVDWLNGGDGSVKLPQKILKVFY